MLFQGYFNPVLWDFSPLPECGDFSARFQARGK